MRTLSQQELAAVSGGSLLSVLFGPEAPIKIGIISIKAGAFTIGLVSPLINVLLNVTWRREWADEPPIPGAIANA